MFRCRTTLKLALSLRQVHNANLLYSPSEPYEFAGDLTPCWLCRLLGTVFDGCRWCSGAEYLAEHANVDHEMINLMGIQKLYMGLAWVCRSGGAGIVPLFTLGASAARLSARRRDERLASLRLIGASTTLIVGLSVASSCWCTLL